jgi:hypothetical protein
MLRGGVIGSMKNLASFYRLTSWEHEVLNRGVKQESISRKVVDRIPWSGVAMFAFMMIFFGVDLAAGIKHTAKQMREKKSEAENSPLVKSYQQKQWSVEQAKQFRDGEFRAKNEDQMQGEEAVPRAHHTAVSQGNTQKPRNMVF